MSLWKPTLVLVTFTTPWILRFRYGCLSKQNELVWLFCLLFLAYNFVILWDKVHIFLREGWRSAVISDQWIGILLIYCIGVGGTSLIRQRQIHSKTEIREPTTQRKNLVTNDLLKPLLFPCRTSHTRIFPKKHSFSFSYLFVGIPVGWRESAGTLLSADLKSLPCNGRRSWGAWFSVESADHLERGDSVHGLRGKLESFLETQVCCHLFYQLVQAA